MKIKAIIYSVFISLAFIACNDDLSSVGLEIQPEGDRISVRTDTVSFTSSSQLVNSIFIKTSRACLGSFDDPLYGNIKYSYLCNFYTSPDKVFLDDVVDDKIDSVSLKIFYVGFVGDSLAPMGATVREVTKKCLGKDYYSNVNPEEYIDRNAPALANIIYTARNLNVPDSIYLSGGGYILGGYRYHGLEIKLLNTVGERIYNEWKKPGGKETFKNLNDFFEFFKGVYIESTYGSGNILKIVATRLEVHYNTHVMLKDKQGKDSITVVQPVRALFSADEEATLLNIIDKTKSKEKEQELISDPNYTYLKTPAGVVTQLEISLQDIVNKVGDNKRIFNNVSLTLETEEQPAWKYTLSMPNRVLLISPDSVKPFFEEGRLANNSYRYFASRTTSSAYKYDFGNISNLIQSSINKLNKENTPQEEWPPLKLWVIPVEVLTDAKGNPFATTNYFTPSGAKLKTGRENLKLYITTTKSNK